MQFGSRLGRSTSDLIFICKQILDKGWEQQQIIRTGFIDMKKIIGTVSRDKLFRAMEKFRCSHLFLYLVKVLQSNITAIVRVGGKLSDSFEVNLGVK